MKTKSKAVVGLSKLTPEAKAIKAQAIIDAMQNSGNFPNATMPISYAALQTIITNLHNAIVTASNGLATDVSTMHEEERVLVMAFNLVKAHVEMHSNTFINPDAIILSSGMLVATNAGQNAITDLTLDAVGSGNIQIRVPRTSSDKAFCYQYALDSAPTTWIDIGSFSVSKITLNNQTAGSVLHFRYAPIGKNGMGTFSSTKTIMVV